MASKTKHWLFDINIYPILMETPITHYTIAIDSLRVTLRHSANRPERSISLTEMPSRYSQEAICVASTTLTRLSRCPKARYRIAYNVTVAGQQIGKLYAIPSQPEASNSELISFEFDNSMLYGSWLQAYQTFTEDLQLDFNAISSIDLAADFNKNLSQVVVDYLRNEDYDCRSQKKPIVDERNLGHYNNPIANEIETIYIGKRGKRDNPIGSSQLTIYNKAKLLLKENKPWIENFHKQNGLVGTVYRAEVRLTNQALNRIDYFYTLGNSSQQPLSVYEYKNMLKSNPAEVKSYCKQAIKQSIDLTVASLADPQILHSMFAQYFGSLLDIRARTAGRFTRCAPVHLFDFTKVPPLVVNKNIYVVEPSRNTNMKRTIKTMIQEAFKNQEPDLAIWAEYLAKKHQLTQYYQKELALVGGMKKVHPPKAISIFGMVLPNLKWN